MSISGISTYSNAMYQWRNLQAKTSPGGTDGMSGNDSQGSLLASSTSLSDQLSSLVELTRYAMDAMGLSNDSRVTFSQIDKYRQQLEDSFNTSVQEGLKSQGVDSDIDFTLQVNDDGSVTVQSSHEDSSKIQAFFDANPDVVKTYRQIEALSGIDAARASMQFSPSTIRKRLQIESMAAWWAASGNSSYFGSYSSGKLSLMAGLNLSI